MNLSEDDGGMSSGGAGRHEHRDWVTRLGRAALRFFPRDFRARHGRELLRLHRDLLGPSPRPSAAVRATAAMAAQGLAAHRDARRGRRRGATTALASLRTTPETIMDTFLQDVRYAVRTLAKQPGFTAVAVLSLALGIGANASVFSFVNAFVLKPLPYAEPERLQHVWAESRQGPRRVSVPDFLDWREQSRSFTGLVAVNYTIETLTDGEHPEEISGARISANALELLGVAPLLGRGFSEGEDRGGADGVALLSAAAWRDRHGADPGVLGRVIEVNGRARAIVGVLPDGFHFPLPTTEVWIPRRLDDPEYGRDRGMLQVVGRLADGVTVEQAEAEMDQIAVRLRQARALPGDEAGVRIEPLREALNFAYDVLAPMSVLLVVAVGFVLLIACANVANLLLARATTREREMALRSALGAGRRRLIGQLLTESAVIALLGAVLGVALARYDIGALDRVIPRDLYRVGELRIDAQALVFAVVLSLFTAGLFGLVPALRASSGRLSESLKEGSAAAGAGRQAMRMQNLMVGVEIGLAVVLLVGTALMVRTLGNLQNADLGFARDGVMTVRMLLRGESYDTSPETAAFHAALVERAEALPGVRRAATVNYLPLNHETSGLEFTIAGQPVPPEPFRAVSLSVTPGYFDVMRVPVLAGRGFGAEHDLGSPGVAVIDDVLAGRHWPDADPLGARLLLESGTELTVIGVVGATRQVQVSDTSAAVVYVAQSQSPWTYLRLLVRTDGDPTVQLAPVRSAISEIDPLLPVSEPRTLAQVVDDFFLPQQILVNALFVLAVGALLLATIGVYGLMAFFVSRRVRDIGIHVALGATKATVRRMIIGRILRTAGAAVAVGLVLSFGLSQALGSFLYGVGSADPATFGFATLFLLGVAITAGLVGARRATRIDPMLALRAE